MTNPVIARLADQFRQHRESYRRAGYNETQLRQDFLDPFFIALGRVALAARPPVGKARARNEGRLDWAWGMAGPGGSKVRSTAKPARRLPAGFIPVEAGFED